MPRAAIVGAGVSGLTAGYRLHKAGWEVTVFEAEDKVGGRIETLHMDGYVIDTAATAVGGGYAAYRALAAEAGVTIVPSPQVLGIERDGKVHLLKLDRALWTGLTSRLLSARAKLRISRLAFDVLRAKRKGLLDYTDMAKAAPLDTETARSYALRVLGDELDQYLCEPITRAMLIADTDQVSVVELFSGMANAFGGAWGAVDGGAVVFPQTLAAPLDVRLSCPATEVVETDGRVAVTHAGRTETFDGCVVACPLPQATQICTGHQNLLAPLNAALPYTSAITVAIGTTRRPDCPALLVQFASLEDPVVAMLFLDHHKSPNRTPPGHALFTAEFEFQAAARMMDESDEVIVERALQTILRLFPELAGTVAFSHVRRWPQALAHTKVGVFKSVAEFSGKLDPRARVQFAADYMSEAGQNTGVVFGTRAAENLIASTTAHPTPSLHFS